MDGDGYGLGQNCTGFDCNDNDNTCHSFGDACCDLPCIDNDLDGYGLGECLGIDCDDDNDQCHTPGDACCGSGTLTCDEVLTCAQACGEHPMCIQNCVEMGDADAQQKADALITCLADSGCAWDNYQCILTYCSGPAQACWQDTN